MTLVFACALVAPESELQSLQAAVDLLKLVDLSDEVIAVASRHLGVGDVDHATVDVEIHL